MPRKPTVSEAANEFVHLKADMKRIEQRLDELKGVLEPALREQADLKLEFNGWRLTLVEFEKESFSLSKAKEKIDGRILAPYISRSNIVQIRPSWQGGDICEKAA